MSKLSGYEIEGVHEGANLVGESPMWHPIERVLYWVDTRRPALLNPGRMFPNPLLLSSLVLAYYAWQHGDEEKLPDITEPKTTTHSTTAVHTGPPFLGEAAGVVLCFLDNLAMNRRKLLA